MSRFFRRSFAAYLVDPVKGGELVDEEGGVVSVDQPDRVYPIRDGILRFMGEEGDQISEEYDRTCERQGYTAPDEHTFRLLPRQGLGGWGEGFWERRAMSTATLWHYLEERRRERGQLPVDVQGVAAEVTTAPPYIAYALDVGGYITVALSPYAGRFALGAYPYTRYYRVQAGWGQFPLKPNTYDLMVITGGLPEANGDIVLQLALNALRRDGDLIITDTPHQQDHLDLLNRQNLTVIQRPVRLDDDENMLDKMKSLFKSKPDVPPLLIARKK